MSVLYGFAIELLKRLAVWIFGLIQSAVEKYLRRKKIIDSAQASVEPLKKATDGESIDKASDSALNGT